MPRPKKAHPNAVPQNREPRVSPNVSDVGASSFSTVSRLQASADGHSSTTAALGEIFTYDEGWLRIVSHEQGAVVYFKYKFSRGKYAGSYVFYRCDDMDYRAAFWGLLRKVEAVYAGTLRPTPDTPYD